MEVCMPLLHRVFSAVFAALAALLFTISVASAQAQNEPIITFNQTHPLVDLDAATPLIQVYANGQIVVNRPVGMRNPGQFTINLEPNEIAALLQLAQSREVANFDDAADQSDEVGDTLVEVSDPTTSYFEFKRVPNTDQLADEGSDVPIEIQVIKIDDVVTTAEFRPGIPGIKSLEALHNLLIEFVDRTGDLQR